MYKAILINPKLKTVTEVELAEPILNSMYKHMECELISIAGYMPGGESGQEDTVFADDEGLFVEDNHFATIPGITQQAVAGNMLIVGCDEEGETISPQYTSLADITKKVVFIGDRADVRKHLALELS